MTFLKTACLMPATVMVALAATACSGGPGADSGNRRLAAFGDVGAPPVIRGSGLQGTEVPPVSGAGDVPATPEHEEAGGFTPEEEIVFTDPDDPEASMPELSGILAAPSSRRGPWERSLTLAKRQAVREGKPILIWFTDSMRSPKCQHLNDELFAMPAFQTWANEHLIRLRIDKSEALDDSDLSLGAQETLRVDLRNYVKRLKDQYRVLGYPSLVVLGPSGQVVGRYRGYDKGEADFTWGLLKQAVAVAESAHRDWHEELGRKGYRLWTDRKGREVFAKLSRYRDGVLTLVEPDGRRSKTHEATLSPQDRDWLDEQKRRREIK